VVEGSIHLITLMYKEIKMIIYAIATLMVIVGVTNIILGIRKNSKMFIAVAEIDEKIKAKKKAMKALKKSRRQTWVLNYKLYLNKIFNVHG
jgi:hypothetical protein